MAVTYATTLKATRLNAVSSAIGTAGVLEIGTAGMASVLATIPLANPAAPTTTNNVLTFDVTATSASASAAGTAAEARITDGTTAQITGLTVGLTGTDITLDSLNISAGQTVTINSATITHG